MSSINVILFYFLFSKIDDILILGNKCGMIMVKEVSSLLSIQDAYPKMLIARIRHNVYQYEGIRIDDFSDWLISI
jgi:hypothetical protein